MRLPFERSRPNAATGQVVREAILQMLLVGAVGVAASFVAHAGQGMPARLLFVIGGIAMAGFCIRRSPWLYLTCCFWFWTIAPCFRRIVDYYVGFDPTSIMLAVSSAMTLFTIPALVSSRSLRRMPGNKVGLVLAAPLCYGMLINMVSGDVFPAAVAAADWLVPLLYYFYLLSLSDRIHEAEEHFLVFLTLNLIVIAAYGLDQYADPQDWDNAWIRDSGLVELGGPLPFTIRLFGTMNMPGPLAVWVATVLLLGLYFRTPAMLLALPAGGILLLLALVRGAVGMMVVGLIGALMLSRSKVFWNILKSVALLVVVMGGIGAVVFVTDQDLSERITERFQTVNELRYDSSAEERRRTYDAAPAWLDAHPFGAGIAALGRGAVAAGRGQVVIDAGPVAIYLALGWIGGTVYLVGIIAVLVQAVFGARNSDSTAGPVLAAATIGNLTMLIFDNAMGVQVATLWLCAGYASALFAATRRTRHRAPACLGQIIADSPSTFVAGIASNARAIR